MSGETGAPRHTDLRGHTIVVIDDSEAVRTAFEVLLSLHGARVLGAAAPVAGLALLEREPADLVIQDMNFHREATSGTEGVALFRQLRARFPQLPVILLTAWTHLETAVELVREGAADYIAKPWDDARLLTSVRNLLDLRGIVYESEALHTLVAMATQVAHADVPVLITGPNGAGKEVLADIVQANSE